MDNVFVEGVQMSDDVESEWECCWSCMGLLCQGNVSVW
jgi:hypothetical protein